MTKVLHFTHADSISGSGRSATRIHVNLKKLGAESRMLVSYKVSGDDDVQLYQPPLPLRLADQIGDRLNRYLSLQDLFIPSSYVFHRHPWVKAADVIQLFNPWRGSWSFTELPRLSRDRPVVLRLSDQWIFTGHCVYDYGCNRWQSGCGRCPQVRGERELYLDTSALLWRLKRWAYAHSRLVIVAPSTWMARLAARSPLIGHFPIHYIPNGVDATVYTPTLKAQARSELGISAHSKVILFTAYVTSSDRKGGHLLRQALAKLPPMDDVELLMLGKGELPAELAHWKARHLGYIEGDTNLARVYAAADVLIVPSVVDNLPNSALESMACGTPVIAFDVGGMSDAVRHLETGYLAPAHDPAALATGIETLLTDDDLRMRLSERSRQIIEEKFTQEREAQAFLSLYQSLRNA